MTRLVRHYQRMPVVEAYFCAPVHDLGLLLPPPSPPVPFTAAPTSRRRRHDFSLGGGEPQGVLLGRGFNDFLSEGGVRSAQQVTTGARKLVHEIFHTEV